MLRPMTNENERRGASRAFTQGTVLLVGETDRSLRVLAQLINVTERGFAVSHFHKGFSMGEVVKFQQWFRAQVIWTRDVEDHVETGFLILR